ncbi:hypothetical protein F5148DRAFT_1171739 [Russula earlei]|uniref:Uncharacterized protein n=1 Tax=Russula earlei TaxID=71964 RepID=A0ACC0UIC1_9AGAM|nr:hypothetical protein F5148DRAFT_1171739 [Russula earlei]
MRTSSVFTIICLAVGIVPSFATLPSGTAAPTTRKFKNLFRLTTESPSESDSEYKGMDRHARTKKAMEQVSGTGLG